MSNKLPQEEMVTMEELVVSHSYEMLALIAVLERKSILYRQEVVEEIKELYKCGGES